MFFPLFVIPVLVGLLAQSLKPIFNRQWYATLSRSGKKIPRYGGMPSAHTAFAVSIATVIGVSAGINSPSFVIAVALVIFILDDALRMRIFLSRHGLALSRLVKKLPPAEQSEFPYLETRLGHKGSEVIAGAALGLVASLIMLFFRGLP